MSLSLKHKGELKGFALVTVLILVSILSLLALEFSHRSGINLKMSINYSLSKKALYLAFGGYQAALSLLINDDRGYDGPGDLWYQAFLPIPLEDGSLILTIEDEKARFNIKKLVTENGFGDERRRAMLERMFNALDIEPSLIDALIDWQDTDDLTLMNGAETAYYSAMDPPYSARNDPMVSLGELLLIKGFNRDIYFLPPSSRSVTANEDFESLYRYITVFGGVGNININTADVPVLLSLSKDIDESIAMGIVEYRNKEPFTEVEDLKKVQTVSEVLYDEIKDLITVKSDIFRITASGISGEFEHTIEAIVIRESRGFRVVYFNRSL